MKKYLAILVAAMIGLTTQAQIRTSRTYVKSKSRTEWIVRAGLSINNMADCKYEYHFDEQTDEQTSFGSRAGFDVDFGFNKYFGKSQLYWGMELGFATRGMSSSYKYDGYDDETYEANLSLTNYTVKYSPFTIGYKFNLNDKIQIDPHLGAYVSYDLGSSTSWKDSGDNDQDFELVDEMHFDAGLQFGIGVWYGRFNLDFMYQRGFINSNPEFNHYHYCEDASINGGKTSNLVIRLGVRF